MILDTKDGFASFYALSLDQYEKKKSYLAPYLSELDGKLQVILYSHLLL